MSILKVNNLSKNYGSIRALQDVSFEVPEGAVFGILGPNGSGKTTLLGIITDVLKARSGSYQLFDEVPTNRHRKLIGTLLETPNFYHYLSGKRNLRIAAAIKEKDEADIDRVLEIVDLVNRKDSKFSTYSLGMKQRLAVASCLLGDPDVLIFDEPTNGLDPVGIAETRELIKKLNRMGKTIIMASHLLDEVEKVCTHVAVLQKGKLLTYGHVNEILTTDDVIEVSSSDNHRLFEVLKQFNGFTNARLSDHHVELQVHSGQSHMEPINRFCFEQGIVLTHLRLRKKSLETKFFELTQQN